MSAVLRALVAVLLGLGVALGAAACGSSPSSTAPSSATPKPATSNSAAPKPGPAKPGQAGAGSATGQSSQVPQRVAATLAHIDAGDWPAAANSPGTHGGDPFGNREGRLPPKSTSGKQVNYREWDINPKKPGQGRDAERIITGDDGSAWYTLDHYAHFTRIR